MPRKVNLTYLRRNEEKSTESLPSSLSLAVHSRLGRARFRAVHSAARARKSSLGIYSGVLTRAPTTPLREREREREERLPRSLRSRAYVYIYIVYVYSSLSSASYRGLYGRQTATRREGETGTRARRKHTPLLRVRSYEFL